MSDLIPPNELAVELMRLSEELAKAHDDTVQSAHDYAQAERDHTIAYAKARASAEGRDADTRKANAEDECAEQKYMKTLRDLLRQSCRDQETNLRQQMSALQTVAQTVKHEIDMGGFQGRRGA